MHTAVCSCTITITELFFVHIYLMHKRVIEEQGKESLIHILFPTAHIFAAVNGYV